MDKNTEIRRGGIFSIRLDGLDLKREIEDKPYVYQDVSIFTVSIDQFLIMHSFITNFFLNQ